MEKSGKRNSFASSCRLLILICILSLINLELFALEAGIVVSSFEVVTGKPVTVEVTVLNATPGDTTLEIVSIPESFVSGLSRKTAGTLREQTTSLMPIRTTVFSREWIPSVPGRYSVGPFTVVSGKDRCTLPSISIQVTTLRNSVKKILRWVPAQSTAVAGTPLRIVLEGRFSGSPGVVHCAAPENAILEPLVFTSQLYPASEVGWVSVAVYNWTPLSAGDQELPHAELEISDASHTTSMIASRPAKIRVYSFTASSTDSPVPKSVLSAFTGGNADISESSIESSSLQSGGNVIKGAADTEIGAAAVIRNLRRAEYNAFFPQEAHARRIAAEKKIRLNNTLPVPLVAWKSYAVIAAVIIFFLAALIQLPLFRKVLRHIRIMSFLLLFLSLLFMFCAISMYVTDRTPAGVVTDVNMLHVPERNSSVIEKLAEGSAVKIVRYAGGWAYIETADRLRGWIPAGAVLRYTGTIDTDELKEME